MLFLIVVAVAAAIVAILARALRIAIEKRKLRRRVGG